MLQPVTRHRPPPHSPSRRHVCRYLISRRHTARGCYTATLLRRQPAIAVAQPCGDMQFNGAKESNMQPRSKHEDVCCTGRRTLTRAPPLHLPPCPLNLNLFPSASYATRRPTSSLALPLASTRPFRAPHASCVTSRLDLAPTACSQCRASRKTAKSRCKKRR